MNKRLVAVIVLPLVLATALHGQTAPTVYTIKGDLALSGYDAVSYFKSGKPTKGKPEFSYQWMDAAWHFSSADNLNAFKAEPEKYAPQYGGYCAFGASQGHLVPGDPRAWKIVDDKLYLNYNKDVLGFWLQDVPGNIQKADDNWLKLHK
jgi:YHS domain-containing protein